MRLTTRTAESGRRRWAILALLSIAASSLVTSRVAAGDGWVSRRVANLLVSGQIDIEVRGSVARGVVADQEDQGLWLLRPGQGAQSATQLTTASDWDPDLEIDADGTMHIAFTRTISQDSEIWRVRYGTNASGAWTFSPVHGNMFSRGLSPDLELTADGEPVIAYTRRPGHAIYLARPTRNGWTHEHIPTSATGIRMVLDLELAPNGRPRVLHHTYQGPLVLATRGAASWSNRVIADEPHLREAVRYNDPKGLRACSLGPLRTLICAEIPSSPNATWADVAIGGSGRAWVGYGRYTGIDACGFGSGTCMPWTSRER